MDQNKNKNCFSQFTSDFFDLSLIFEAFVIDAVRLNPPGRGSALEYPELMSSDDLMQLYFNWYVFLNKKDHFANVLPIVLFRTSRTAVDNINF